VSHRRCWGIFREGAHSPGRETDDTEILRLTGKMLEAHGFEVTVKNPEEIADSGDPHPPALSVMCERLSILRTLRTWEAAGARVVNAPLGILDTYRERTLRLWKAAHIPFPPSRVVSTRRPRVPDLGQPVVQYPLWVKRADVHYVEEGDVIRVWTPEEAGNALAGLARRGISRGVLQAHIDGDLLKFYGIAGRARPVGRGTPPRWFRHFYHRDQEVRGYPFDPQALRDLAGRAAEVLGLEIFGGDAIVTAGGDIILIDLNAWPSFALFREEAAAEIAAYLEERFTRD
jgi:hypothetical protein